ncbi:MAG: DUF6398 domain-containing protein [Candidatus Woesearchaeota archaeon]
MAQKRKSINVPKEMQERFEEVSRIIVEFCEEKLNEEYKELCLQLCASLCRKRPSPVVSGKANTWACGIVHAIGMVNFLFDSTQKPHIKSRDLYKWFGIAESTGSGKSKKIRDLFKMGVFDKDWTLQSKMEKNPFAWMIQVNGLNVDARQCPPEIQMEAYKRGLIPYLHYKN